MYQNGFFYSISRCWRFIFCLWMLPLPLHASFIEVTMGTAVINDASATYFNPAALTLLKKPQLIGLGSVTNLSENFNGQFSPTSSNVSRPGTSKQQANNYLPSLYVGVPTKNKFSFGFAIVSNLLNSQIDENSILRYKQSNSRIKNIDFIPGVGVQINKFLSIGAGVTYSTANITSEPITRFPGQDIPDSQSRNATKSNTYGGNAGFLLKPSKSTLIGFNYRSVLPYQFRGTSSFEGITSITSNNYQFNYWTPARNVLTFSHFFRPELGLIGTVQRVQWSVFDHTVVRGLATQVGAHATIRSETRVPYHFHDTWTFTVGGIKSITPKWVVRMAGSYEQAPGNGDYQITNGDNMVIGISMGYNFSKNVTLDGGYAYGFQKSKAINIHSSSETVTGINNGFRDSLSIKLTINME